MVHQVGTTLHTDDHGIARRGIIIRHLVLPGFVKNSVGVLKMIAENLSPNIHLSLMSQYFPPSNLKFPLHDPERNPILHLMDLREGSSTRCPKPETRNKKPVTSNSLLRTVNRSEYNSVLEAFNHMGLNNGWIQEYESHLSYRPDFSKKNPFEEKGN